jgi:hypothetical protein
MLATDNEITTAVPADACPSPARQESWMTVELTAAHERAYVNPAPTAAPRSVTASQ